MEAGGFEPQKDLGKAHFQQELNRWFESKGIISDLRSHLRHLMITALQNTQIGLKPSDKTSPKAQALNLIVAEYLFRRGCHYTLSVFTSEVPTLANFSAVNPTLTKYGAKASEIIKKPCFQEKEFEEISNALGMTSSFEELEHIKARYFRKGCDYSLIEVFFQYFMESSTKSQVRKNLESYEVDESRKLLSEKWSAKIVDILLSENIKSAQIATIKQAISRITESEMNKIIQEEHRKQLQILAERENRIQEYLRRHEEGIFLRLMKAEKDLNERKDMIDEELSDRQKQLTEMTLEWNEKHEEILKLSKSFHDIENENMRLQKKIEKMEEENQNLKSEGVTQKKAIEQLEMEKNLLMNRLQEVTDSYEQMEALIKRENSHNIEEENVTRNSEQSLIRPSHIISGKKNSKGKEQCGDPDHKLQDVRVTSPLHEFSKSRLGSGDNNHKPNIDLSEDESDSSSNSYSCDRIISNVRKNLQVLEEESNRINKNYLDYKLKSQNLDSDSETSIIYSEKSQEKMNSPVVCTDVIKESRFCQTTSPDLDVENILRDKQHEEKKLSNVCSENLVEKSVNISLRKSEIRTPTKRQQQNREFFLKSRQLLKELEKKTMEELSSEIPFITDSSAQNLSSNASEEVENFESVRQCVKSSSKEPAPSLYYNKEPVIRKESPAEEVNRSKGGAEIRLNHLPNDDETCLALLEETRIKSPKDFSKKMLRQHILQLESDSNDENEKSKEDKCNKSPNFLTPNIHSGKVLIGKKSDEI